MKSPADQLNDLHERLAGLVLSGIAPPDIKPSTPLDEADRIRGEWARRLMRRIEALHADYAAFARAQVEAAKPESAKLQSPPPTTNKRA